MTSIPKGYKQSEIGIIPEDWEVKLLSEISEVVRGGVFSLMPKTTKSNFSLIDKHGTRTCLRDCQLPTQEQNFYIFLLFRLPPQSAQFDKC